MEAESSTRVRRAATAVAVVGAVIGVVAIVQSATSSDSAVGIPSTSTTSLVDDDAVVSQESDVDAMNSALADEIGATSEVTTAPTTAPTTAATGESEAGREAPAAEESAPPDGAPATAPGIAVETFGTRSFGGDVSSGTAATIDSAGDEAVDIVAGTSSRWRGQIVSEVSGDHQFFLDATGRATLWVNGYQLVRGWQDDPTQERSGTTYLEAGRAVDVYLEFSVDAEVPDPALRLEWQVPDRARSAIPADALSVPGEARVLSVTPQGAVDGDGSEQRPVSLQRAADLVRPGDTVQLASGTYTRADESKNTMLTIDRSGSPGRPITFTAAPGATPVLQSDEARIMELRGASYIVVSGLAGVGPAASVTADEAIAQLEVDEDGAFQYTQTGASVGILVNPIFDATDVAAHHVTISGNTISEVSGCGICVFDADHAMVTANTVTDSTWWHPSGYAAISVRGARDTGGDRGDNIVISGNRLTGNENRVVNSFSNPDPELRVITGGGGISVQQVGREPGNGLPAYTGGVVVVNNLIASNGGFGLSVRGSDTVKLINNTLVDNAGSSSTYIVGEIEVEAASGTVLSNNVVVPRADRVVFRNPESVPIDATGNLVAPTAADAASLTVGFVVGEPAFTDRAAGDFSLGPQSAALGIGDASRAPGTGIDGTARPPGGGVDAGAFQSG